MNKINNIAFRSFGFVLSKIEGVLDMPSRIGQITYDWGDYIEPLVEMGDIVWGSRTIKSIVLFNGDRFDKTLTECLIMLENLPREFILTTAYGEALVSLKKVTKRKGFTNRYAILDLEFEESKNLFLRELPKAIGGNGIKIDTYDLKNDFGVLVSKIRFNDEIPEFKKVQANKIINMTLPPYHRKLKQLLLDCVMPFNTIKELTEKTAKLQKLLSLYGLRTVLLEKQSYKCFITSGFNVKKFDTYIKFTLKLTITQDENI